MLVLRKDVPLLGFRIKHESIQAQVPAESLLFDKCGRVKRRQRQTGNERKLSFWRRLLEPSMDSCGSAF